MHLPVAAVLAPLLTLGALLGQQPTAAPADAAVSSPAWTRSRVVWFAQGVNPVAAELCVGAAAAPWDDAAQQAFEKAGNGDHVALGNDGWATLDSFTALRCGEAKIKKGCYYLALEKGKDGWALLLFEPGKLQKAQLLPQGAAKEKAALRLPLQHADVTAAPLGFELVPEGGNVKLQLHWGPHQLSTVLEVQGSTGAQPNAQSEPRGCSRLALAEAKDGKQAFALLDHGQPAWNAEREAEAQKLPKNGRWRFGQNWWTTLETNCALALGGKKLGAGSWHLSLRKAGDDSWHLVCTPAADDVGNQIDAFAVDFAKASVEVPLQTAAAVSAADKLSVRFVHGADGTRLVIGFGPRELATAIAAP